MKKIFLIYCLLIMNLLVTVSCNKNVEEYKEHFDNNLINNTSLRFINNWGGSNLYAEPLQRVFDEFMEENTNIKVINESMSGEDFITKLKIDFASGNEPDVFGISPGSDIKSLIDLSKVADLTEIVDNDVEWKASFKELKWRYTVIKNRIYGLPLEIFYIGFYINKDLFEKYKVKEPETYQELKNAINIFRQNDIIPIAYNLRADGSYLYQSLVANIGGREGIERPFIYGKPNYCYTKAMDIMKELYKIGAFQDKAFTMSSLERDDLFIEKKAAMIVQTSDFNGNFKENENTVKIIPFPKLDVENAKNNVVINSLGSGVFYVSNSAWDNMNKKSAAIKLLKTLTSKKNAAYFSEKIGMLSNVDISGYNIRESNLSKTGMEVLQNSTEKVDLPESNIYRYVWENVILKEFPYILEERETQDSMWEKAYDLIK